MKHPWNPRLSADDVGAHVHALLAAGHTEAVLVHDLDRLRSSLAALTDAFPAQTLHAVAIKANPLVGVLKAVVESGAHLGLEAASIEEVHLALAAGCAPGRIVYDSPAKTREELAEALHLGVRLNADNREELERIAALRPGPSAVIGVRVNPAVGAGAIETTSVASPSSRFGVSIEQVPGLLADFPFLRGLHVHVGSQGSPLEQLVEGVGRVVRLADDFGDRITTLDIGGGLPTSYRSDVEPPSPYVYAAALRAALPGLFDGRREVVTEFGRALLAGCGFALSPVEYVKTISSGSAAPPVPTAVIRLGADLLLRPAYRPQEWKHEFLAFDAQGQPRTGPQVHTKVAGPLCFAGDVIGDTQLPVVQPGDFIAIRDTGAYTMGMWSRHCSRGMPRVLGLEGGHIHTLRQRETPADIVRFWS